MVLRDIRLYHAGSANTTNSDRILPGFVIGSVGLMAAGLRDDDDGRFEAAYRPARTLDPRPWEALQPTRLATHLDYVYNYSASVF